MVTIQRYKWTVYETKEKVVFHLVKITPDASSQSGVVTVAQKLHAPHHLQHLPLTLHHLRALTCVRWAAAAVPRVSSWVCRRHA